MRLDLPEGAHGYKVRMVYGNWWLQIFNTNLKNICDYGPLKWSEVPQAEADAAETGLINLEKNLGDRGK